MIKAKSNTNNNFWETRRMVQISNKPRKYQVYFSETQLKVITNECNFSISETLLSFINSLRAKLACLFSPFSRVWLCDPMDHGPPGSPVHGILQASILEWMAISFSSDKEVSEVKSLSRVRLFVTPWTVAYQAPLSMGFSRQEYWNGLPLPSPKSQTSMAQKRISSQSSSNL